MLGNNSFGNYYYGTTTVFVITATIFQIVIFNYLGAYFGGLNSMMLQNNFYSIGVTKGVTKYSFMSRRQFIQNGKPVVIDSNGKLVVKKQQLAVFKKLANI